MSGRGDSLQNEKIAAASFAWLSVVVKRGATTLVRGRCEGRVGE